MAFVPGETVEEGIFDDLVATLEAIAPPTHNTAVARVFDCTGRIEETPELPAIVAYHGGARLADSQGLINCEQWILTAYLALGLASGSDDPRQDAMRFVADVNNALTSTRTRGGLARDTIIRETEIVPRTREDAIQAAAMTVEVVFAHPVADPTTNL